MKKGWISAIAAAIALGASVVAYARLPELIAVHFGPGDEPNGWMSKPLGVFLLPGLMLLFPLLRIVALRSETDPAKRTRMASGIGAVVDTAVSLLLGVHLFILAYNLGYELSAVRVATVLAGMMFLSVGNVLPTLPQSSRRTMRLPEPAYRKLSRFVGRLMVASGFVLVLSGVFLGAFAAPLMFAAIAAVVAASVGGAFYYGRR